MTRIPPTLSYLTIYNPTLQPNRITDEDDEDAEAQAHILFYTSNEKAVSRDRMLRQVGLAKALVNFAEFFNNEDLCDNVHSQARRMVMVSPEPDYWIHVGIEVAKSHRVVPDKGKGKAKDKMKPTSIPADESSPVFEYHEGSVQDEAIRSLLLRGYEQFKLTHGSFTQIMSDLGQEALELQLERFFTVWAWSLNLEEIPDFGEHLGVPCHPLHRRIAKLLDSLEEDIFVYCQSPHVVVPTRFFTHGYPLSLLRHLLNIIPKPQSVLPPTSSSENNPPSEQAVSQRGQLPNSRDAWKWYWPLTFGGRTSPKLNHVATETEKQEAEPEIDTPRVSEIDECALKDAISSSSIPTPIEKATTVPLPSDSMPIMEPRRAFVHLSDPANSLLTRRKELYYFIDDGRILAVIPSEEREPVIGTDLAMQVEAFFMDLEQILVESMPSSSADQLPSAAKILQPLDQHVAAKDGLTISNPLFSSRSLQLYETKAVLDHNRETSEVFSRGQNPQHWHIAKRGIGTTSDNPVSDSREVYLEVFRKESSLADVDNVLAGIVRKSDL
ncbi:hypothetical protein F5887DRAFT_954381 [Amanita rubescens]|nr:hypothetical protein F5887DRAFT_954381 [Amanita rubescens]